MWLNYFSVSLNDNADIIDELHVGDEIVKIKESKVYGASRADFEGGDNDNAIPLG